MTSTEKSKVSSMEEETKDLTFGYRCPECNSESLSLNDADKYWWICDECGYNNDWGAFDEELEEEKQKTIPTKKIKYPTGTREWADSNVNLYVGCSHDCRYCYAKQMALRFGRATKESWKTMILNLKVLAKTYRKRQGRIMFPSTHDITRETLLPCVSVLDRLLQAGNEVLITTKPHLAVIKYMTVYFHKYKKQIQFRFTIGSMENMVLSFWEPGAPKFEERLSALKYAFEKGYKTSVSIEPILSSYNLMELIATLEPFVTETIWLGTMNRISVKVLETEKEFYRDARAIRNQKFLHNLEIDLRTHTKIRYKDSIKKILGLPQTQKPVQEIMQ